MKRQACSQDKRPEKQDKTLSRSIKKSQARKPAHAPPVFPGPIWIHWRMGANLYTPFCEGPAVFPPPLPLGCSSSPCPLPRCQGPPRRTAARRSPPDLIAPRPAAAPLCLVASRSRCSSSFAAPICHSPATAPPENRIESTKIFNSFLNSELPPPRSPQQVAPPRPVSSPRSRRPAPRAPSADRLARLRAF